MPRTVTVSLADLEGIPHGANAGTSVTIEAAYTSEVVLLDGTIIPTAIKQKGLLSTGLREFSITRPSERATAYRNVGVRFTARVQNGVGARKESRWERTVVMPSSGTDPIALGNLLPASPLPAQWASVEGFAADMTAARQAAQAAQASAAQAVIEAQQAGATALQPADAVVAAAIVNPATATSQAIDTRLQVIRDRTVLVDDFRQAGDADDGPAFRRAAAAASRVALGPKQYVLTPATLASGIRQHVPMSHGVAWVGPGRDVCEVKVGPNSGDYHAIFGPDTGSSDPNASIMADLSSTTLTGFTIDGNATDNPITSYDNQLKKAAGSSVPRSRIGLAVNKGIGIEVDGMRFEDFQSIWCVQLLGRDVHRGAVLNTQFLRIGHDTLNWDHTSIYLDCGSGGRVERCEFQGRAHAARQPYELHGSRMYGMHNIVDGYVYGMDITGSTWHGPGSGRGAYNQFLGVASGLDIWTGTSYGVAGQYGIDGFSYDHNLVKADHVRWGQEWYVGLVTLNGGASLPMRALTIADNEYYLTSMGTPHSLLGQYSQVISLARSAAATAVTGGNNHDVDIAVERNKAYGSVAGFARYVHPGGGINGYRQVGNVAHDVGQGGTAWDSSRNAALLMETGTVRRARHLANEYNDTRTPRGLARGAYYVAPTIDDIQDDGSRITTADNASLSLASTTSTTGAITMRGSARKFVPTIHTARFTGGATMLDESTGTLYRQAATGSGAWTATT